MKNIVAPGMAVVCLVCSLTNNPTFGTPTLAAFFSFSIAACIAATVAASGSLRNKTPARGTPLAIIFYSSLILYYLLQGWLQREPLTLEHYLLLSSGLLLVALYLPLSGHQSDPANDLRPDHRWVALLIVLFAGLESLICLFQFAAIIPTANKFFRATGTWVNPNVIAMFLAMTVPAALFLVFSPPIGLRYKVIAMTVLFLTTSALAILQCRTAWVGALVATLLMFVNRYGRLSRHSGVRRRGLRYAVILAAILLVVAGSVFLYRSKQASADGRLFIWKVSLGMVMEKPLTGWGYGRFERDYNLAQARYIGNGHITPAVLSHVSYTHMGYNEFLDNAVEGGIIGFGLFSGFLLFLLLPLPAILRGGKTSSDSGSPSAVQAAAAGVAAYVSMSILNFTFQAIPATGIFLLYAALVIADDRSPSLAFLPGKSWRVIPAMLIVFALATAFYLFRLAEAYRDNRRNELLAMSGRGSLVATDDLADWEAVLAGSSAYWTNYGNRLFDQQQYAAALDKYQRAQALSSDPDLYFRKGLCFYRMADYSHAEEAWVISQNIEPGRFVPRFRLLQLYVAKKDTTAALRTAVALLALPVRVPSDKIQLYKNQAREIMTRMAKK